MADERAACFAQTPWRKQGPAAGVTSDAWYYLAEHGKQEGPFAPAAMHAWHAHGYFTQYTFVRLHWYSQVHSIESLWGAAEKRAFVDPPEHPAAELKLVEQLGVLAAAAAPLGPSPGAFAAATTFPSAPAFAAPTARPAPFATAPAPLTPATAAPAEDLAASGAQLRAARLQAGPSALAARLAQQPKLQQVLAAAMTSDMWYYLTSKGEQSGPFELAKMHAWYAWGYLGENPLARLEWYAEFHPALSLFHRESVFKGAPEHPAAELALLATAAVPRGPPQGAPLPEGSAAAAFAPPAASAPAARPSRQPPWAPDAAEPAWKRQRGERGGRRLPWFTAFHRAKALGLEAMYCYRNPCPEK